MSSIWFLVRLGTNYIYISIQRLFAFILDLLKDLYILNTATKDTALPNKVVYRLRYG